MSIEKNLERIATALEKLASGAVDIGFVVGAADEAIAAAAADSTTAATATETPVETPAAPAPRKRGRKPKSTPAAPAAPATETFTVEAVREALRIFLKENEPEEAKAILAEFNSPSITALDPQHYGAVLGRLTA